MGTETKKTNGKHSIHEANRYLVLLKWILQTLFSFRYVSLLILLLAIYYYYLNSLYLVDEITQGDQLRELMLSEKTTIVVRADKVNEKSAKSFVEYYSLCKPVHEVVVIWDQPQAPPSVSSYFIFAHTHSKVKFHHPDEPTRGSSYVQFLYDRQLVETESVMFLDPDVLVECDDLAFSVGVWRSANASVVGYFPRLHRVDGKGTVSYGGATDVWRAGSYSFMLPAGALLSKLFLWDASPQLVPLFELLHGSPGCAPIAFSLYPYARGAAAPVWVEASVSSKGPAGSSLSSREADKCLEDVSKALSISLDNLAVSRHKASRARNHVFW